MRVLVTGAAGFVGMHSSLALMAKGASVVGVDSVNHYYNPALKLARLEQLQQVTGDFSFHKLDLALDETIPALKALLADCTHVLHLAAQAGVRYSLEAPLSYVDSNLRGTTVLLESVRQSPHIQHVAYASSSSVYGNSPRIPFREDDPADAPLSLYAASKRGTEHIAAAYTQLYGVPSTGLRFFTVYGPWGRPDMAYFHFARDIMAGTPIKVFGEGKLQRDFTYIDDIVSGVIAALERPGSGAQAHRVFNLGNHHPHTVLELIDGIEKALDKRAELIYATNQPGDATLTYADIGKSQEILGFNPQTTLADGLQRFAQWFISHGMHYA